MHKRRPAGGGAGNDRFPKSPSHNRNFVASVKPLLPSAPNIQAAWFRLPLAKIYAIYCAGDAETRKALESWPSRGLKFICRERKGFALPGASPVFARMHTVERGFVRSDDGRLTPMVRVREEWGYFLGAMTSSQFLARLEVKVDQEGADLQPADCDPGDAADLTVREARGPPAGANFLRRRLATAVEAGNTELVRRLAVDLDLALNGRAAPKPGVPG